MNPMLAAALGSIIRFALAIGAGYLVRGGVWSQTDATLYIEAATLALVSLGWSLFQKWYSRQKLVTTLMLAKTTERSVEEHIATSKEGLVVPIPSVPSVMTPVDEIPKAK